MLEWAASRFEMWGGMDASVVMRWRPDLGCGAEWTPCESWCGVQIGDLRRNGRHVRVGVASRLWMWGGMDAMCWSGRRPDLRFAAEWTPCADVGGVQIVDVGRNGRHVRVGVASRFEICGGMDAMSWSGRRPDCGCREEWTSCADVGGVQIGDVERNGRHVLDWAASRFEMWGGMDAMCWSGRRPDLGCEVEWTPCVSDGGVQIVDVGQNGRHVLMRAASRFEMLGGMDAMSWSGRRPD